MSNYAISHSETVREASGQFTLAGLYRNWKARRQVRRLRDRDDRLLDDIGVTRDEVIWASYLPLSVNAATELEKVSFGRRKQQQFQWHRARTQVR